MRQMQEIVIHSKRLADLSGGAFRQIPPMLRMAGLFCSYTSLKQASFWESQRIAKAREVLIRQMQEICLIKIQRAH